MPLVIAAATAAAAEPGAISSVQYELWVLAFIAFWHKYWLGSNYRCEVAYDSQMQSVKLIRSSVCL